MRLATNCSCWNAQVFVLVITCAATVAHLTPQVAGSRFPESFVSDMIENASRRLVELTMLAASASGAAADLVVDQLPSETSRARRGRDDEYDVVGAAPSGVSCPIGRSDDCARNVSEVIRARGFEVEELEAVTADGYILGVQRIVNPLVEKEQRSKLRPVILQHGLLSSSVDWVLDSVDVRPARWKGEGEGEGAGEDDDDVRDNNIRVAGAATWTSWNRSVGDSQEHPNSLGYYLANEGFDVYLANSRGNVYSRRHQRLSEFDPEFWDFTFDEQVAFDLPATIALVQKTSGRRKIAYVGHSQGTTMMFGLLAERPEFADVVEPFVALAPVAFVRDIQSPLRYLSVIAPFVRELRAPLGEPNAAFELLARLVCGPKVVMRKMCSNILFLSVGYDEEELDDERADALLAHFPAGTSVKNVAHWGQGVRGGRFAKFDYGPVGNLKRYKQLTAPDYHLSRIRSDKIALFAADNDWLAGAKDVARLRASLTVEPLEVVNMSQFRPKWNHVDFIYAKSVGELLNTRVLGMLERFRR